MPETQAMRPQSLDTIYHDGKVETIDPNQANIFTQHVNSEIITNKDYQSQIKQISGVTDEIAQNTIPFLNKDLKSGKVSITFPLKGRVHTLKLTEELKKAVKKLFSQSNDEIDKPLQTPSEDENKENPSQNEGKEEKTFREEAEDLIKKAPAFLSRETPDEADISPFFSAESGSDDYDNYDISGFFSSSAPASDDSEPAPGALLRQASEDDLSGFFSSSASAAPRSTSSAPAPKSPPSSSNSNSASSEDSSVSDSSSSDASSSEESSSSADTSTSSSNSNSASSEDSSVSDSSSSDASSSEESSSAESKNNSQASSEDEEQDSPLLSPQSAKQYSSSSRTLKWPYQTKELNEQLATLQENQKALSQIITEIYEQSIKEKKETNTAHLKENQDLRNQIRDLQENLKKMSTQVAQIPGIIKKAVDENTREQSDALPKTAEQTNSDTHQLQEQTEMLSTVMEAIKQIAQELNIIRSNQQKLEKGSIKLRQPQNNGGISKLLQAAMAVTTGLVATIAINLFSYWQTPQHLFLT